MPTNWNQCFETVIAQGPSPFDLLGIIWRVHVSIRVSTKECVISVYGPDDEGILTSECPGHNLTVNRRIFACPAPTRSTSKVKKLHLWPSLHDESHGECIRRMEAVKQE